MRFLHRTGLPAIAATSMSAAALTLATVVSPGAAQAAPMPFLAGLHSVRTIASTVPRNGDVNPYGVAVVPTNHGRLHAGSVLVSNFNNGANLQGTGRTIVQITPAGHRTLFANVAAHLPGCPGGTGLTTALSVLRSGWVIVGSLPTNDGTAATAKAGCLVVLNDQGTVKGTLAGHGINGPWDMTAADYGNAASLFVTNVLNGTVAANGGTVHHGTVLRIDLVALRTAHPRVLDMTTVASGFAEHSDPAALVVGPTGVALARNGTLYVADTAMNRIAAVPHANARFTSAGTGITVTTGGQLNAPLGLTLAPDNGILTVNGGDGMIVETSPGGHQLVHELIDSSGTPPGAGALFGLAVTPSMKAIYFVDDATNQLDLLHG
jgi:hypothetical protein